MFSIEFLLKLLKCENISKLLYTFLFLSLLTVGDFISVFILGHLVGIYLYMAIVAILCLMGVIFLSRHQLKAIIKEIDLKHEKGIYPKDEFYRLIGSITAAIFIIFPGITTTIIGFILIIPVFSLFIGRKISKRLNLDWNAVYEYKEFFNS